MLYRSHRYGLGNFRRYGCFVDSIGVTFICFSFMNNFCSFRVIHSFYICDSLFLTFILRVDSDRQKNVGMIV